MRMQIAMRDDMNPDVQRKRQVRRLMRVVLAAVVPTFAASLVAAPAEADCVTTDTTTECTGDLSTGKSVSDAVTELLYVHDLTANIGDYGFSFSNHGSASYVATFELSPYSIAVDPTFASRTWNFGLHLFGNADVEAHVVGDVDVQLGHDDTVNTTGNFNLNLDHTAAIRLQSNNDGDVTLGFDGNLTVDVPTLDVTATEVATSNSGFFAGIRTFTGAGDTSVTHTGTIEINSGDITARSVDNVGDNRALARETTGSPNFYTLGIYGHGAGKYTLDNTGTIEVHGADVRAETSASGARAESLANAAVAGGITIDWQYENGINRIDPFPVMDLTQNGDVTVTSGDAVAIANAATTDAGDPAEAVAVVYDFLQETVGVDLYSGYDVTLDFTGNVDVSAGESRAEANTLLGLGNGLLIATAEGRETIGVTFNTDPTDGFPTLSDITVDGDITAHGGAAAAVATGTGAAINWESGFPPTGATTPDIPVEARGGAAFGIFGLNFEDNTISYSGAVDVEGGAASAVVTGANLKTAVNGGSGSGFFVSSTIDGLDFGAGTTFSATGGDATATLAGTGLVASVGGGFARAARLSTPTSSTSFVLDVPLTAQGGSATLTGDADAQSSVEGGAAEGAELYFGSYLDTSGLSRTFTYTGNVEARGGDAAAPAGVSAIGGGAIGIIATSASQSAVNTFVLDGTITATAGTGMTRDGSVQGLSTGSDFVLGGTDYPGGIYRIRGDITATGEGIDVADVTNNDTGSLGVENTVASGILSNEVGNNTIIVENNARVEANGAYVHGIVAASQANTIQVASGATVIATGANGSGIEVRPYQFIDDPFFDFYDAIPVSATTAAITVDASATVTSTQGVGIKDDGRAPYYKLDFDIPSFVANIAGVENTTTLDVAGTVTGGGGTAIDLGTGADMLTLRSTAIINGAILLGPGNDRLVLDGYSGSEIVDGGADEDTLVVDVASTETLDVAAQPIANFEVIEKTGAGTLTLDGSDLPNAYRLGALGGLTTTLRDFTNLAVKVGDGATVKTDHEVGDVTTESGGTFGGNASVASLVNNGIVSPGNSIGVITVTGDAEFNSSSVYQVEIQAPDQADRIDVGGTATIDGGNLEITKLSPDTSYQTGQTYRIMNAGAVVVNDGFVFDQPLALLNTDVVYGADYVDLTLTANVPFTTRANTYNQFQSATGLQDFEQSGDALAVYNDIVQFSLQPDGGDAVRSAFDLASGEIHASGQYIVRSGARTFTRTLQQQAGAALGEGGRGVKTESVALGYASTGTRKPDMMAAVANDLDDGAGGESARGAFVAPLAATGSIADDGNAAALDWQSAGLIGGYEGPVDVAFGRASIGFGAGYIHSNGTEDARLSSLDADGFHLGAYGAWTDERYFATAAFAVGTADVHTARHVLFGGIDRTAEASYWSQSVDLEGEIARPFDIGDDTRLAPLATVSAGWAGHPSATETGAGSLNLTVASQSQGWFDTGLGVAVTRRFVSGNGMRGMVEARAVWEHGFGSSVPLQGLAFAGSPTAFTVAGPDEGSDRLRLGLSLGVKVGPHADLRADYDGMLSATAQSHSANVGFKVHF